MPMSAQERSDILDAMRLAIEENPVELRPSVHVFAQMMELTLRRHGETKGDQNGKNGVPGWRQDPIAGLARHLISELDELMDEFVTEVDYNPLGVAMESIDVAAISMMVWDNVLKLEIAKDAD